MSETERALSHRAWHQAQGAVSSVARAQTALVLILDLLLTRSLILDKFYNLSFAIYKMGMAIILIL